MAAMTVFRRILRHFSRSSGVPELRASFPSFRVLTTVSARGIQWVCQFMTEVMWTYTHS